MRSICVRTLLIAALDPTSDNSPLSGAVCRLFPSTATLRYEGSALRDDMVVLFIGNQGHLV
jgi:hypothetical protein